MRSRQIDPESVVPDRLHSLEAFISRTLPGLLARLGGSRLRQQFTYAGVGAFNGTTTSRDLTITWPKPFADTMYTIMIDVLPPTGSTAIMSSHASAKTTTGCVVTVFGGGATIPSGAVATIDAIHL